MDSPGMVAVPSPICTARSGRVALQGTSLGRLESALTDQGAIPAGLGDMSAEAHIVAVT